MTETRTLIIGTRDSKLATWQAEHVSQELSRLGHQSKLEFVKTEGDAVLDAPLHQMGGKGVFTKALDEALFQGDIDIAVHSFKDIPTTLPEGLMVAAVLEREDPLDVLVTRNGLDFLNKEHYQGVIATSSNRRASQWLHKYPEHKIVDIRGNVQTRLRKLRESDWDATIFALAGLKRLGLDDHADLKLDWMLPAPAQGAMAVMIRSDDERLVQILSEINHEETELCTRIERDFLFMMEAGCSAPVGAYAFVEDGMVTFRAVALMPDGSERFDIEDAISVDNAREMGVWTAEELLSQGADKVIRAIRKEEADEERGQHPPKDGAK